MTQRKRARTESALKRLKVQLESGKKTAKKSHNKVDLTDKNVKRIKKEISNIEVKLAA